MKRFFTIPLIIIYLLASIGVWGHQMSCITDANKSVQGCGMEEPIDCCTNHSHSDQPEPTNQQNPLETTVPSSCSQNTVLVKTVYSQLAPEQKQVEESVSIKEMDVVSFSSFFQTETLKSDFFNYRGHAPPGLWEYLALYKLHKQLKFHC